MPNSAFGIHVQQQDFLAVHRKTGSQVVDGSAFAYAARLVCYTDYLWFRHFRGFLPSIDLVACGEADGYVRA